MKVLLLVISSLFILGCSQEKKVEQQHEQKIKESVVAEKVTEPKKESVVAEPQKSTHKEDATIKEEVKKRAVVEVEKVATEVVPKEVAVIDKKEVDGSKIFVKCAGCHGKDAEKKALGKSKIIKDWDEMKVADALHGYKDGTYGGTMKTVMNAQVSNLSDDEINAVAKYISKL